MGRISALTELTTLASDDYLVVLDSSANIAKKISIANAFGIPDLGYTAAGESWTYASATTITVPTDATTKYGKGMIIKFTQATGGTKYAVLITVAATLFTIRMLNGATLANEAITSPFYTSANPLGAGLKPSESLEATVAFLARRTTDEANYVSGAATKVSLATEDFDLGANFDNATNYRFTAPVAGIYHFSGACQIDAPGAAVTCYIYKNGANTAQNVNFTNTASDDLSSVISITLSLAAGDTVDLRAVHFAGTNRTLLGSQVGTNFLSGYMVGRT